MSTSRPGGRRRAGTALCALLLLGLLARSSAGVGEAPSPQEKRLLFAQQAQRVPARRERQLLVSLANGNLVALDQETGETLWTFETGAPLVSSTPITSAAGGAGEGGEPGEGEDVEGGTAAAARAKDSIFPGTDGSLYAYRQPSSGEPPRIEKLPVTVSELVNESPAPTLDGSLVMGSQHTTVFLIDGATGQLIRTFLDYDGELNQLLAGTPAALGLPEEDEVDLANAVVIGRKDYVLRSVHPQFGEQWNVTWSQVQRLSELEVVRPLAMRLPEAVGGVAAAGGSEPGSSDPGAEEAAAVAQAAAEAGQPSADEAGGLMVGPDFSLRRFDPASGWERWAHKFDAVPIAAYSSAGGRVDLLAPEQRQRQQGAAAVGGGDSAGAAGDKPRGLPIPQILERVWQGSAAAAAGSGAPGAADAAGAAAGVCTFGGPDEVMLGMMRGSLFGIPASHLTFDAAQQCQDGAAEAEVAFGDPAVPPSLPDAPSAAGEEGEDPSDGALVPFSRSSGMHGEVCQSEDGGQCTVKLGMYKVHKPAPSATERSRLLLLPASANESRDKERQARQEAVEPPKGWPWVMLVLIGAAGGSAAVLIVLRGRAAAPTPESLRNPSPQVEMSVGEGQPLLSGDQARRRAEGGSLDSEGTGRSKSKKKNGALKGKQMSNALKGALMQAAEQPGPSSAGGSAGTSRGGAATPQRSATEGREGMEAAGAGEDGLPSSAAVQQGLQSGAQRREVRDGKMYVGRMRIGPGILGYGSGGTVVFEGELDGRPVAVKRLLRQFYDLARKEIGALVLSDEHPNIVRVFGLEEDHEFCYLALERCQCTLSEAMQVPAFRKRFLDEDGKPTAFALRVAEDVGCGLEALHARDIVHRDLKPHNVLLTEGGRAKISDMGLSKRLVPEQASFESVGSGGSSGWQAPEQLVTRSGGSARQTRSVDVFSYGLLVHYCLTGGAHPFGESYERDANILMGRSNLKHLAHLPLAADLVRGLIAAQPGARPPMPAVMCHPLWWDVHRQLGFLIDVSDRVEGEDRAEDQTMYQSLELLLEYVVGPGRSWAAAMDSGLVNNLGKYRRYSYSSLRDLLRVIRNKHNHFRELPGELQKKVGPLPEGFLRYFTTRYPGLLPSCFYFALRWCADEPVLCKYYPPASRELLRLLAPRELRQEPGEQVEGPQKQQQEQQQEAVAAQQKEQQPSRPGSAAKQAQQERPGSAQAAAQSPAQSPARRPTGPGEGQQQQQQASSPVQQQRARPASAGTPDLSQARPASASPAPPSPAASAAPPASPAAPASRPASATAPTPTPAPPQPAEPEPARAWVGSPATLGLMLEHPGRASPAGASPAADAAAGGSPAAAAAATSSPTDGLRIAVPPQRISLGSNVTPAASPLVASPAQGGAEGAARAARDAPGDLQASDSLLMDGPPVDLSFMHGPDSSEELAYSPPEGQHSLALNLPASPLVGGTPKLPPSPLIGGTPTAFFRPHGGQLAPGDMGFGPGMAPAALFGALPANGTPNGGFAFPVQQQNGGGERGERGPRRPPRQLEPQLPEKDISPVGIVAQGDGHIALFPHRPGQPVCDFFMKTGHCRFGETCRFDHPSKFAVKLNKDGLPIRPGEPPCSFYERFGECRYKAACKYDHSRGPAPVRAPRGAAKA